MKQNSHYSHLLSNSIQVHGTFASGFNSILIVDEFDQSVTYVPVGSIGNNYDLYKSLKLNVGPTLLGQRP